MKRLCILLLALLSLVALVSCGDEGAAPDGYYLASDPERDGCYFVVPDGWQTSRSSGILSAYVSNLNTANVSVAFTETALSSVSEYWDSHAGEFENDFDPGSYKFGEMKETKVGGKTAYQYFYDASYEGVAFRFMQYIIPMGDTVKEGLCLITCTGSLADNVSGSTDFEDQYETFLEMVEAFRFSDKKPVEPGDQSVEDENAPKGMKAVSRKGLLGFTFYVPEDWTVNLTGGYVQATPGDGTSLGVSAVDYENAYDKMAFYNLKLEDESRGFTLLDYWNVVKAEYGAYFDGFTVIEEPASQEGENGTTVEPVRRGDVSYYRYVFEGVSRDQTFKVSLYVFRETDSRTGKFYTLLYTATPETHAANLEEVEALLGEVRY